MKKSLFSLLLTLLVALPSWAIFPMTLVNNSQFADNEVYVAIIGKDAAGANDIYYNLQNNSATNVVLSPLTTAVNTLHKTADDWGYADVFVPLSSIPNKTIYIDRSMACRVFFGFKSPMYLHVHATGGYAGAALSNPSDPNADLRWELIEFSYDGNDVMFVNTSRVDAFQYPMGIDLYGNTAAGANNAHMRRGDLQSYAATIAQWTATYGSTIYNNCKINHITKDALGPIIMQPSKVDALKNSNAFDSYINQIWTTFASKTLRADMGQRGVWYGRVENDVFVMHNAANASEVAYVSRPTTNDVIEGAGTFATGSGIDKAVQAQFCGAMNRGMIMLNKADNELQNWGQTNLFFTTNTWNEYVKFFHRSDLSHDGYTYAFAYDDTFDQSSTCATSHPASLTVTIGGFTSNPGATDVTPVTPPSTDPVATNNVSFNALPDSMQVGKNYTVRVDYSAAQNCEVMVCLFKGEWNVVESNEQVQQVTAGTGSLTFNFTYTNDLAAGTDYIWKCELRPTGGSYANHYLEQLVKNYHIYQATTPQPSLTNNVSFNALPDSMQVGKNYTVQVDYSAAQNCEVMVCLFKGEWNVVENNEQVQQVSAGTGSLTFNFTYTNDLAAGTDYIWKCELRPTGGSYANHYLEQLVKNYHIYTASASGTDPVTPQPSDNSGSGTTAEGLEYTYTITQNGTDVTFAFTVQNASAFTGLVPFIWDNTNDVFSEQLNVDSYTFTYPYGTVVKVACKWAYAGGMTVTPYIEYVMKNPSSGTSVSDENAAVDVQKVLRNGRVVIIRDGVEYDVLGRRL